MSICMSSWNCGAELWLRRLFLISLLLCATLTQILADKSQNLESNLNNFLWRTKLLGLKKSDEGATLYGNYKQCLPPNQAVPQKAFSHLQQSWSSLFSRYKMDGGKEIDIWLETQENNPETADEKPGVNAIDIFLPLIFPVCFGLYLVCCLFVLPILGGAAFHFIGICYALFTHPEFKRFGRRYLITKEKLSRKRQKILTGDTMKKPPRDLFHLPNFFRIHSDEDVPVELEDSDPDEMPSDEEPDESFSDEGFSLSDLESSDHEKKETPKGDKRAPAKKSADLKIIHLSKTKTPTEAAPKAKPKPKAKAAPPPPKAATAPAPAKPKPKKKSK